MEICSVILEISVANDKIVWKCTAEIFSVILEISVANDKIVCKCTAEIFPVILEISVANDEVVTILRNVLCWVLMKVPMAQIHRAAQHVPVLRIGEALSNGGLSGNNT